MPPPPPPEPKGDGRVVAIARASAVSLAVFIGYRQFSVRVTHMLGIWAL
jgi:hypothetical protein